MKKSLLFIAFAALALTIGAGYVITKQAPTAEKNTKQSGNSQQTEHKDEAHEDAGGTDPTTLPQTDLTKQTEVTIEIKDYLYTKPNIKIKKGTKVTWVNQDVMQHNAMRAHDGEEHAHDAPKPNEIRDDLFAGPMLRKGEKYTFTFTKVESLTYHCAPHPYMKGAITIVE